jgi:hypothetical protein
MNRNRIVFVLALLLPAAAAPMLAQFEGEADFRISTRRDKGGPIEGTARMYSSRTGFRMEYAMPTGSTKQGAPGETRMTMVAQLPNPEKVYLINDENKTYSVWDTKSGRESKKGGGEKYEVEKLGSDTVAGYSCQNARLTSSKGNVFDVCVTRELGASSDWIAAAMNRNDPDALSWVQALKAHGIEGFPIRWSIRSRGSKQPATVMELTRAQKKAVPAAMFQVPPGYKQTDFAVGGLTPEQEKAMGDARAQMNEAMKNMSPEERKQLEEMMKRYGQPTPVP